MGALASLVGLSKRPGGYNEEVVAYNPFGSLSSGSGLYSRYRKRNRYTPESISSDGFCLGFHQSSDAAARW